MQKYKTLYWTVVKVRLLAAWKLVKILFILYIRILCHIDPLVSNNHEINSCYWVTASLRSMFAQLQLETATEEQNSLCDPCGDAIQLLYLRHGDSSGSCRKGNVRRWKPLPEDFWIHSRPRKFKCVLVRWSSTWGTHTLRGTRRHFRRYAKISYGVYKIKIYTLSCNKH
jgi:hypothetical protein